MFGRRWNKLIVDLYYAGVMNTGSRYIPPHMRGPGAAPPPPIPSGPPPPLPPAQGNWGGADFNLGDNRPGADTGNWGHHGNALIPARCGCRHDS